MLRGFDDLRAFVLPSDSSVTALNLHATPHFCDASLYANKTIQAWAKLRIGSTNVKLSKEALREDNSLSIFSSRIAIDLGTAYSIIAQAKQTELVRVASSVAMDRSTQQPVAFGNEAKKMIGRCPERYEVIRPLRDGVIADFTATSHYLRHLIGSATKLGFAIQYDIFLCVPWGATAVELRSYQEALGGPRRKIYLVREPFAAALGLDLDIFSDEASTVLDMGGGTSEVATIAGGYMVMASSLRAAGSYCDQLIMDSVRQNHQFEIGLTTAEAIKIQYGSVWPTIEDHDFEIKGLLRKTQLPDFGKLNTSELRAYLEPYALKVESEIRDHLQQLPSEARRNLELKGLFLAGGTSLLSGWKERLENRIGLPIHASEDAYLAVIRGMQKIIENPSIYRDVLRISESV